MEAAEILFFITWLGQSCFLIESKEVRILIDPFGAKVGYPVHPLKADIVTVSHEHFDHNNVDMAEDSPIVLRGLTKSGADWAKVDYQGKGVKIRTVGVYHDDASGAKRGKNAIFLYEIGGLRVVHTGDLGHPLSEEQVKQVGPVDILMICVGGYFTVGPEEATAVAKALKPRVLIPMHFKTEDTPSLPIGGVDAFLKGWDKVVREKDARWGAPKDLAGFPPGQTTVVVLPFLGEEK
ncbi:MAG: MBL fold metallo-hydrolase [Candidatus Sumerlaeota bacterium]|nr:MBL fold metallo-hydrolase [Candidatus Sumerlaeota bacterium]